MLFRCRICSAEYELPTDATAHVGREHDVRDFGWHVERVPETTTERVAAGLSNLPLRLRSRLAE